VQNKFRDAEAAARRAVESLRLAVGPNDASTATALYNLAGLSKRLSDVRGAEAAYGEALRIFTLALGEGAGETADTLYQVSEKGGGGDGGERGRAAWGAGDKTGDRLCWRGGSMRARACPATVHVMSGVLSPSPCPLQMGCLYRKAGDWAKAGSYFARAAGSYGLAYGSSDKRVSESTKRARMMAGKIAEGGLQGSPASGAASAALSPGGSDVPRSGSASSGLRAPAGPLPRGSAGDHGADGAGGDRDGGGGLPGASSFVTGGALDSLPQHGYGPSGGAGSRLPLPGHGSKASASSRSGAPMPVVRDTLRAASATANSGSTPVAGASRAAVPRR
jgi:hypothetical protein